MIIDTPIDDFDATFDSESIDRLVARMDPEKLAQTSHRMRLAAKIFDAMKRKGWNQTRFAQEANQHVSVISKWLSGTHNFTVDTLVSIQLMLDIRLLDAEERHIKPFLDVRLTVRSEALLADEEIHRKIHEAGGMLATHMEEKFELQG